MKPEPPSGNRRSITEVVGPVRGPIEPDAVPTAPPPAMPMMPPVELRGPRKPPPENVRSSQEISTDTLLAELARQSEAARLAKAEADALRADLATAKREGAATDRRTLVKLATRLGGPLVLLMGAATAWLGAHTANVEAKVDRVEQNRTLDKVTTDPLPAKVQTVERNSVDCREWARQYDDYNRQIWARFGVSIPKQPNALPSKVVEFSAPKARANRLNSGVILEVKTQPPQLP